jgi:hypothetical protein
MQCNVRPIHIRYGKPLGHSTYFMQITTINSISITLHAMRTEEHSDRQSHPLFMYFKVMIILLISTAANHIYVPLLALYVSLSKSFRTGRLEPELQTIQLSATRRSCIAILWVCLVSFAVITLFVASQRVFVVVYFVIDSIRKLLDTPSCVPFSLQVLDHKLSSSVFGSQAWSSLHLEYVKHTSWMCELEFYFTLYIIPSSAIYRISN